MTRLARLAWQTAGLLILALGGCAAPQQARPAETILADIDAVEWPEFNDARRDDEAVRAAYEAEYQRARDRAEALVLELYEADPDHERLAELIGLRWRTPPDDPQRTEQTRREVQEMAARHPPDSVVGREARHALAGMTVGEVLREGGDSRDALEAAEQFIAEVPGDERGALMLFNIARRGFDAGSDEQVRLFERVRDEYADSPHERAASVSQYAAGQLRQLRSIGEPFDFAFTCAVTGRDVTAASLRGQVLVIDFWATWCPPCVAKMPEMKDLYERYRDRGVEFIGISLDLPEDRGGLERLRRFVDDEDIPWPQWYLGDAWQSEFVMEWGISGIPTIFIVDAEGRLRSTTARYELEDLIPALLAERQTPDAG